MKRKLPLCAWCGKPLARTTYRTIEHEAVLGRPIYGWHWGKESPCDQEDGEGAATVLDQAHNDGRSIRLDAMIARRGPGRVLYLTTKRPK